VLAKLYVILYSFGLIRLPPWRVVMSSAPLTEVRERLSEIVDEVSTKGTEMTITKHGRPVAVLLGAEEYESLIETLNILSDSDTMSAIGEGLAELDSDIPAGS
jgi:antitoxin YefM